MSDDPSGPAAPGELDEWIRRFGVEDGRPGRPSAPGDAGLRALEAALERTGRNREGAFALLAADALLTSAARDCMELQDPAEGLRELLERVAAVSLEQEE